MQTIDELMLKNSYSIPSNCDQSCSFLSMCSFPSRNREFNYCAFRERKGGKTVLEEFGRRGDEVNAIKRHIIE